MPCGAPVLRRLNLAPVHCEGQLPLAACCVVADVTETVIGAQKLLPEVLAPPAKHIAVNRHLRHCCAIAAFVFGTSMRGVILVFC